MARRNLPAYVRKLKKDLMPLIKAEWEKFPAKYRCGVNNFSRTILEHTAGKYANRLVKFKYELCKNFKFRKVFVENQMMPEMWDKYVLPVPTGPLNFHLDDPFEGYNIVPLHYNTLVQEHVHLQKERKENKIRITTSYARLTGINNAVRRNRINKVNTVESRNMLEQLKLAKQLADFLFAQELKLLEQFTKVEFELTSRFGFKGDFPTEVRKEAEREKEVERSIVRRKRETDRLREDKKREAARRMEQLRRNVRRRTRF